LRRIIGATFVSLDGVMQGPGGPTEDPTGGFQLSGWLPPVGDEAIDQKIGEIFGRPFDLLLGRRTYEIFAAYWPYANDQMKDIRDPFNACTKYVVTHRDQALEWENSRRVCIEDLHAIKQSDGTVIGNRTKIKVVKNKVAAPFTEAEFDIMYNEGISSAGSLLDLAIEKNILEKRGSWLSYKGSQLAQGRDAAKEVLKTDTALAAEIEEAVKAALDAEKK